ncbi:MAG: SCP2 sterol-binding domain-containing protein [Thermodesulfobacteriota bacterium]
MAARVRYLSPEWVAEAESNIRARITPDQMKNLTVSMSNIYRKCPDGQERYLFFGFTEGALTELTVGTGEAPSAEFVITGDYEVFARISRAELGSQKALMTGKLKLKGNMVKALKLASIADRINKVLSEIETEY